MNKQEAEKRLKELAQNSEDVAQQAQYIAREQEKLADEIKRMSEGPVVVEVVVYPVQGRKYDPKTHVPKNFTPVILKQQECSGFHRTGYRDCGVWTLIGYSIGDRKVIEDFLYWTPLPIMEDE